jgi:pyridoxamine 5'-phosphate oxidase
VKPSRPEPDPARLRRGYNGARLTEADLASDPIDQLAAWLADAIAAGLPEPNAMVLATAAPDGRPSARTVLLKGYGPQGLRFFTNHTSRKAAELAANPRCALVFPWHAIRRQVVVEGTARRLPERESADYFHSRPHGSQLGAWASEHQSAVLGSAEDLDRRFAELAVRWPEGTEVPAPGFWGGYLVTPSTVEFWQGRPNRLHDRLRYRRALGPVAAADGTGDGARWVVERLSP